jgi:hypothetical protein
MRLTLRNMLASMDEILEPAQQEEIKRKIEESEFATGILHRVRDVTRRIRLGAPKLTGKGMGLDPNTVAMYLDNTLSSERVADFEKVCLESDVHLAEVAACHQILALVLGEPAEVDPTLRRKLYDVGQEGAGTSEAPKVPPPLPAVVRKPRRRERPRVPEYLREPRRSRFLALAATVVLAVLLGAAVIRALGPYDRNNPALAWLPIWGEEQVAMNNGDGEQPTDANRDTSKQRDLSGVPSELQDNRQLPGDKVNDAAESTTSTGEAGRLETGGRSSIPVPIPTDRSPVAGDDSAKAPIPPAPDEGTASGTNTTANRVETNVIPADERPAQDRSATDAQAAARTDSPADDEAPPRGANEPIGRFLNDPNALLRLSRAGEWERVAQGATLYAGDRLLVLPTFRPSLTLTGGLTVQVLGETLVELVAPEKGSAPGLRLPYGRVVLMTAGEPNVSMRLWLGGQEGMATFVDAGTTLAAEVRRFLPAGSDPEKEAAFVSVHLYVPSGQIDWKQSENPEVKKIPGPGRVTLGTPYPTPTADEAELPTWITAEKLTGLDDLGTDELNRSLDETNKRPVTLTMRELAEHRLLELRYPAARSLALMGEFDPLIAAFKDSDQRIGWPRQIESLQAAMARSPKLAAMVRESFEQQRGEDGFPLYRMLWGYSKADIQAGAAVELVEYMDHNSLDYRVLSFYALRSVPGVPVDFAGYQPDMRPADRQRAVQRWRKMIATGPLSKAGAQDRPGPTPKSVPKSNGDENAEEKSDESAARPRTVPVWR